MMRAAAIFLALLLPVAAYADFVVPSTITAVATSRIFNENQNDIIYRATVDDKRATTGGVLLILEKIRFSYNPALAPELLWQEEWTLDDLGTAPKTAFNRLNGRDQALCCDYTGLDWTERTLYMVVTLSKSNKFLCKIPVEMNIPALCTSTR